MKEWTDFNFSVGWFFPFYYMTCYQSKQGKQNNLNSMFIEYSLIV